MKDLFTKIAEMVPKQHGWCSPEKALVLASLVIALRPKLVVEIGVWGGRSLIPMALAVKEVGVGQVIGVDPWDRSASIKGQGQKDRDWWGSIDHELVFNDFMNWLRVTGTSNFVTVVRKTSDAYEPPSGIGICHCDGNHSQQAIRDVERYAPRVNIGGFFVTDDEDWSGGGVQKAAGKLLDMGYKRLYTLGTGACYQRIG